MARNQGKKITPKEWIDIENKLEQAFQADFSIAEACWYAWVSVTMYLKKCKDSTEFKEKMEKAKMVIFQKAKVAVANKAWKDWEFALKLLERRQKEVYSPRHELTWANWSSLTLKELYHKAKTKDDPPKKK